MHIYKIHDKIYDLTNFVKMHPGGADVFKHLRPFTNITTMLYTYHKDPLKLLDILPKYELTLERAKECVIQFNTQHYNYDKYVELKRLVCKEMQDKQIPYFWNTVEIIYNALMFLLCIVFNAYVFSRGVNASVLLILLISFFNIGYGALVFHETCHYTGFKNQSINTFISNTMMSPHITAPEWKFQHNYSHHSFTNGPDDYDFKHPRTVLFRHAPHHPLTAYTKYQFIYNFAVFFLFGFVLGPLKSIRKRRINTIWIAVFYYLLGVRNATLLYGFSSLIFTYIAQISHIQPECIQTKGDDFLCNQITSTVNYRTDNPLTRFICFGLDIQIEHHLFPNIPHSSLRQIQHIVKKYCADNNIPYVEKCNMWEPLVGYIIHMYKMGRS